MKKFTLLVGLLLAFPLAAQVPATPEKKNVAKPAKVAKKVSGKRQQDARHCLERGDNDAIIRCAEEYL